MHQLIRVLVSEEYAQNAVEAAEQAEVRIFNGSKQDLLMEPNRPSIMEKAGFDWGFILQHPDARFRDQWPEAAENGAVRATSIEGTELIESGWERTREEFMTNLDALKTILDELDDEEVFANEQVEIDDGTHSRPRYLMEDMAASSSSIPYLYDTNGHAITTPSKYENIMERKDSLWVVPADMHY